VIIQPNEVRQGDVMIGQSLLTTSAFLLDKKIKLDEGYLLDFCNLVTVLTLHNTYSTIRNT
jgi:hypothetical protein